MRKSDFKVFPREEIEESIERWVRNDEHRQILVERLIHGHTVKQIADEHNLSVDGVNKILTRQGDLVLLKIKTRR